jgi:hypothetical protein
MKRLLTPLLGALALSLLPAGAQAPGNRLASKSIARVYAVQKTIFALAEGGREYSWLDLYETTGPKVQTFSWPWDGGAEAGVPWSRLSPERQSVILYANYLHPTSDSLRIARAAAVFYGQAPNTSRSDSLIFPDTGSSVANGAAFTAAALRADTVVFGFGRFGLAYAPLAPETASNIFAGNALTFRGFPAQNDTLVTLKTCLWNQLCRADSVAVPAGGLDSVLAVAIDSASPDSVWMLVATSRGLRRGLWRGDVFPYVSLPGISDSADVAVRSVFASPGRNLAWAFTSDFFFFSDDRGATWRVPAGSASLTGYSLSLPPQVAFKGDTSFINFNMDSVGIAVFRRDTLLPQAGNGVGGLLINADDSLDIASGEGSLTGLAVAYDDTRSMLVAGATLRGIYYRRLDLPGKTFSNLSSLKELKNALAEVITYPTVLIAGSVESPVYSRIGYRLKKDGKVTITIYNYAMEKVRTVVKNRPRRGGVPRSESLAEDRWDGRDDNGRLVSVGLYYVLVESDKGEKSFGKVIAARGRR